MLVQNYQIMKESSGKRLPNNEKQSIVKNTQRIV